MDTVTVKPWQTTRSTYLIKRDWMNLRKDSVVLPTGAALEEFHVVEYPDWVGVLAITVDSDVILVEQYRHGIESVNLELPAGRIDDGEDPAKAARRELLEETGYQAEALTKIGSCAQEPAKHSNFAHLYIATGCTKVSDPSLDDAEDLMVRLLPVKEIVGSIERKEIVHGIHVMAVLWAKAQNLF